MRSRRIEVKCKKLTKTEKRCFRKLICGREGHVITQIAYACNEERICNAAFSTNFAKTFAKYVHVAEGVSM